VKKREEKKDSDEMAERPRSMDSNVPPIDFSI
jgi:hypothetical protein